MMSFPCPQSFVPQRPTKESLEGCLSRTRDFRAKMLIRQRVGRPRRGTVWDALALASHLRARMGRPVDGAETCRVDVGVALGGREAGMAQQLLDGAQVAAGAQQVGGEG